jgi:flagellar hook-associated protein 3 FlgL
VAESQEQVSSGRRILKASDDPSAASAAMRVRTPLRAVEQYRSNIDLADSRSQVEENTLDAVLDVVIRAKELAVGQAGANADAQTRRAVKAEIDQLFQHVVQLANTRLGDDYIFGGAQGDVRPYALDDTVPEGFTTTSPTGDYTVEIAEGRYLKASHNGVEVFEDTGVLTSLRNLSDALGANDAQAVRVAMGELDTAFDGVQVIVGDVGARTNHLEITRSSLDTLELNLLGRKSELEEVHLEKAMTELVGRQTTLQAAMLATSRVMGLSLANYLR